MNNCFILSFQGKTIPLWCFLMVMSYTWNVCQGHGMLIDPPSRASAWRFGFDLPKEYDDNQLWCGGLTKQIRNGGKCGVCGDDWSLPEPRPHEYGGKYGQGVIVRNYAKDQVIPLKVDLTANHVGYFEFRICPGLKNTTQECLDKYVLELDGKPGETKYYPTRETKIFTMHYKLPKGLTCDHCVIQWLYNAGNNWGMCANGTGALGCGPQEQFRACADVSIGSTSAGTKPPKSRPDYVLPNRTTSRPDKDDTVPHLPQDEESMGSSWTGIIIATATLVFVVVVLAAIYIYYYRGGYGIKNLLMHSSNKNSVSAEPPVRPPRTKKTVIDMKPDDLEPGFHNIKLNNNII